MARDTADFKVARKHFHWLARVGRRSNMERLSTAAIADVRTGEELAMRRHFSKSKSKSNKVTARSKKYEQSTFGTILQHL